MSGLSASSPAAWVASSKGIELPLRLTLVELLLRPIEGWYLRPFVFLLACLGLLFPGVLRSPAAWASLTFLTFARVIRLWPVADNHYYLLAYWCLAVSLALIMEQSREALATSARWLLGFVFVFAVLWKALLAPDYLDGRFFRVTLLTDERFAYTSQLLGGISAEELAENREYLRALPPGAELVDPPRLREPPALRRLAIVSTWGSLLLEGALALAFLLPWGRWTLHVRHGLLLAFCAVTYAFAPVSGFGWLLAVMGLAQVGPERRGLRAGYLVVWFLILFYGDVPWPRLLLGAMGRQADP